MSEQQEKAQEAQERREKAAEKIEKLEEDPPKDLDDWPRDEAKYTTLGGPEGEAGYDDGPTAKLGPSELRRFPDGSIEISGEKVDNPDDYKAERIPSDFVPEPEDRDKRTAGGEKESSEEDED